MKTKVLCSLIFKNHQLAHMFSWKCPWIDPYADFFLKKHQPHTSHLLIPWATNIQLHFGIGNSRLLLFTFYEWQVVKCPDSYNQVAVDLGLLLGPFAKASVLKLGCVCYALAWLCCPVSLSYPNSISGSSHISHATLSTQKLPELCRDILVFYMIKKFKKGKKFGFEPAIT